MSRALVTDLYELNMAVSYLRRAMVGPATFSLFVRSLPPRRRFLVAAGLEDCLAFLESFAFADEDLAWLRRHGFEADNIEALGLRFTGDVDAVPEGRVVLPGEPILEVTAPIAEAQLVETFLLNQVTFQTAVATKAARCRLASGDAIELVDFALRRTHGVDAGMAVARLSAMAGFAATSNVEAARRYGLPAAGTMAHSYVEALPTEADAFRAYAEDRPARRTFLVDTYDTLDGVRAAIATIRELGLARPLAVRLDSGDLRTLARKTRALLDEAGLAHVQIFASGGLDEFDLERLRRDRVPVDAAGICHPAKRPSPDPSRSGGPSRRSPRTCSPPATNPARGTTNPCLSRSCGPAPAYARPPRWTRPGPGFPAISRPSPSTPSTSTNRFPHPFGSRHACAT
jgi:nicotinate phosphoribosyltransferase